MSFAYEVLRFCDMAVNNPAMAGDRRYLDRLAKYAKEAFEGIVALHAPASPMTWETNALLAATVQESNRQSFRFPRPVEIVGFFPTIIVYGEEEVDVPTLDDISVRIDTDNQNYLTTGAGISTPTGGGEIGPFVTLSAMSVQVPRVVGYKLRNPTPDIGFTYRWKLATSADEPVFQSSMISMAIFARYL